MSRTKTNKIVPILSLSMMGVVLLLAGWIVLNKQVVSDNVIGFFYEPTSEVMGLEDRVGFSSEGKRIFRATQPELSAAEAFNKQCPRREDKSPIIGCYTGEDRVYIYNVTNSDLNGIEEVTAAHEMLHAAWLRLGSDERSRLAVLLDEAYERLKDDELKERMEYYKRTEPTEIHNELHSILGTESKDLGVELEVYYSRYFTDRNIVLGYHSQYSDRYKMLYTQSDRLWKELDSLSKKIQKNQKSYLDKSAVLSQEINSFNRRADSGNFPSIVAFNTERAQLAGRVSQLESERTSTNADIERYNKIHETYRDVASKIESLNRSIDSFETLEALPTL